MRGLWGSVSVSSFALLFVVFLDLMSQGVVVPVLTTVLLDPSQGFLPARTTAAARQVDYGLAMGVFFLSWFLGAAYISKLSDSIGRKRGILVCLSGNLVGYVLTIVSLLVDSLALLVLARAISGFTAGNQPIAQAAFIDMCQSEQQKVRAMSLVVISASLGLVVGPLIGGLLSDKSVLGQFASLELPFFVVCSLVAANIASIALFFRDRRTARRSVKIRPIEVFLTLWQAGRRPVVLKLSIVFFFAQLALNAVYVFMDNFFYERFHFDTFGNAVALIVLGAGVAFAAVLVDPISKRYGKIHLIGASLLMMSASTVVSVVNPSPFLAYVLVVPFAMGFGLYYPAVLALFSASVDESEQGWVMGVTVACLTLGAGIISLVGGRLMAIDMRMPFLISAGAAALALVLIGVLWRGEDVRGLDHVSA